MPEKEVMTVRGIRIPPRLWAKLERIAVEMGRMVTPSEAVRRLIEEYPEPKHEASQEKSGQR